MTWTGLAGVMLVGLGALGAAAALVVHRNRRRYDRAVAADMRALLAVGPRGGAGAAGAAVPGVVARYRAVAVGAHAPAQTMRMTHGGTFRMTPTGRPRPIRGAQVFSTAPPGYLWTGRVAVAPGVWIDARDRFAGDSGCMHVLLDDTVTLAHAEGPEIDQGSALRLLAELPWIPTALFDARLVTWSEVDDGDANRARATLHAGKTCVSADFTFGPDGLPTSVTAERYNDHGELRCWGGVYRDWRLVDGMRVPFEVEVTWQLATPFTYAHWRLDSLVYDAA